MAKSEILSYRLIAVNKSITTNQYGLASAVGFPNGFIPLKAYDITDQNCYIEIVMLASTYISMFVMHYADGYRGNVTHDVKIYGLMM